MEKHNVKNAIIITKSMYDIEKIDGKTIRYVPLWMITIDPEKFLIPLEL